MNFDKHEVQISFEEHFKYEPSLDKFNALKDGYINLSKDDNIILVTLYYNYLFDHGYNEILKNELKDLIDLGLDINKIYKNIYRCDSGISNALQQACEYQNLEVLEVLIDNGGDVKVLDDIGLNLCELCILGHGYNWIYNDDSWSEMVKFLIIKGSQLPRKDILKKNYSESSSINDLLDKYLFF